MSVLAGKQHLGLSSCTPVCASSSLESLAGLHTCNAFAALIGVLVAGMPHLHCIARASCMCLALHVPLFTIFSDNSTRHFYSSLI